MKYFRTLAAALIVAFAFTAVALAQDISLAPDPTGAVSADGVYTPPALASLEGEFAGAVSLEDDTRIKFWIALQESRDFQGLLRAAEADLRTDAPHPFATHVWAWAQSALGNLTVTTLPEIPADLAEPLSFASRAFAYAKAERFDLLSGMADEALARAAPDYWADTEIFYAARDFGKVDQSVLLSQRMVLHFPNRFGAAYFAGDEARDGNTDTVTWLEGTPELAGTPAAALIRWLAAHGDVETVDTKNAVSLWLDAAPADLIALRRLGYKYETLQKYDDALAAFEQEHAAYPFRDAVSRIARVKAAQRRFPEALEIVADWVEVAEPEDTRAGVTAALQIKMLRHAGELGRARDVGLAARDTAADTHRLRLEFGKSLRKEGFPDEAVALLAPVLKDNPTHQPVASELLKSLMDAERYGDIPSLVEKYRDAGGIAGANIINAWRTALYQLDRHAEIDDVLDIALATLPNQYWVHGNIAWTLNKMDRPEDAYGLIRESLLRNVRSDWRIRRLEEYAAQIGQEEDARRLLEELAHRYPYKQQIWQTLAKISGDPGVVWRRAIKKAPLESFPVIKYAGYRFDRAPNEWRTIIAELEVEAARMEEAGAEAGEIAQVYMERAVLADDAIYKKVSTDLAGVPVSVSYLDRARALGIPEKDYWHNRFYIIGRLGPSPERTAAALKRAELFPDKKDPYNHLFQTEITQNLSNAVIPFIYYARYLERRPRDAEALNSFALFHNKYGGSSVVALALLERAKRWNPDFNVEKETEYAYGRLGAEKRYYEARYNRSDRISSSARHINWFENARQEAREDQATIKNLDLDDMSVVLLRPDGFEEERRYHPITGRTLYYRAGAFEASAAYTADGDLSLMKIGEKRKIELGYTGSVSTANKRRIKQVVVDGKQELRLEYDAAGNAITIHLVGAGRLISTYSPEGELENTEPLPERDDLKTMDLSMMITSQLDRMVADKRVLNDIESGELFDFHLEDPDLDALQGAIDALYEESHVSESDLLRAMLNKGVYKVDHVADHPGYWMDADSILQSVFYRSIDEAAEAGDDTRRLAEAQILTIEAVRNWRRLMLRVRPDGLPARAWDIWSEMQGWVVSQTPADPEAVGAFARLRAEMSKSSLRALSQSGWLEKSDLANPGFWRSFAQHEVFPSLLVDRNFRMRDVLVRRNGDVVIASSAGIAVLRRGYWEWFGFDKQIGRFSKTLDFVDIDGMSNFSSLAEDDAGRLWLGSRAGLILLKGAYDGEARLWRGGSSALFAGGVNDIAANGLTLAIAGDEGLALANLDSLEIERVSDSAVNRLSVADDGFLVIGRNALWWQNGQMQVGLTFEQATDAILGPEGKTLYVLSGKTLKSAPWAKALQGKVDLQGVEGHEAINATAPPTGLAHFDLSKGVPALTVLFDKGGAVLGEGGFETFSKPAGIRPTAFLAAHERDGRSFVITNEGVSAIVRGQAAYELGSRVYDLLSDPALEVTFVALGWGIEAVDHSDPQAKMKFFSGANARLLDRAPDGALITHDGPTVLRFQSGSVDAQELFDTEQIRDGDAHQARLADILAASDGTIWAVAGASVFRWREGEELEEYSMFGDDPDHRVFSDMLYAMHETIDGRIMLVASNEGHRGYKGQNLYGGLFEFTGEEFRKTRLDVLGNWFMTSYTQIDDTTAIVGTTGGFARLRGNVMEEFDQIESPSYMAVRDMQPALYLGTEGAQLDDDLWLFGSAGGVVALNGATWFFPDKLNWILPGRDYANYGARAVHAIAADTAGRVYIGTDWGLTVYDPEGAGAASFLITEQRADMAFGALELRRAQEVNEVMLDALPADSATGKLAQNFRKNRKRLAQLEERLDVAQTAGGNIAKLEKDLRRTRQRDLAILAKMEQEEPLLFNMLQLNPLDLRALGKKLPDNVVVVQYLPTESTLYINLVSKSRAELRQVDVSREELDRAVTSVIAYLSGQARGNLRGFELSAPSEGGQDGITDTAKDLTTLAQQLQVGNQDAATQSLAWLYDMLLRPAEHSLKDDATIVISPTGSLAYLPFSALIREIRNNRPVYAVEQLDLATSPSLYALDLMIDAAPSTAFGHLIVGDPDGTLAHARAEAEAVAEILADDLVELRIGKEATYDELVTYAADARYVHLAMHGKLDHQSPKDSYLLLAENRRMSIPQIMTLPMSETELVFLSACETALGRDGLEFRTIAHAFAHAGAPAIIATLWQVEDKATRTLAEAFYKAKVNGASNAEALAQAQRQMIAAGGDHADPGFWAAAIVMGKP
ncbi:CHAT domain-containing protein [Roseovarius sp. ZX-A-9]|uniref:CHAT domain-containing protein n=1 Tax=Roseovarius sp. ZX-A-9 TaxID=3014783 RepID=UPI00232C7040|nr:CHAT domain-containing protein [Roseovarius sp. ZX-A-9]